VAFENGEMIQEMMIMVVSSMIVFASLVSYWFWWKRNTALYWS